MIKRVLLMISSMRGGGSERQTLLLLKHLDRSRFEPHLFLLEREGSLLDQVPKDVTVHDVSSCQPPKLYFPGRMLRRQAAELQRICGRHSIDVIYDRTFRMTLLAAAAVDSAPIPRVSTIVSPPERAVPLVEQRLVGIKRKRLAAAYRNSRHIIAVSDQAARSAERYYGLAASQVETIANPVDREQLLLSVEGVPAPPDQDPARLTLVVVGRMSVEKGHGDLIAALRLLDDRWQPGERKLRIRMVGDGPLRPRLVDQVGGLQYHDVEFVGPLSDPASEIATANALVLPSHFEGMPNVVLEAMALRTDVIATRAGGTLELERNEPTLWWAEANAPASLAQAIEQWSRAPEEAARRNESAYRMICEHHDIKQTARRIEDRLLASCQ